MFLGLPVLFKLKPGITEDQITELRSAGEAMVGVIPGLKSFKLGAPLKSTAHRAQGFDMGLITVMDTEEQVLAYGSHEAHQRYVSCLVPLSCFMKRTVAHKL